MNPAKYWNPGRAAVRIFAAVAFAATFFLVPGATHVVDEAIADAADAIVTEESTTANATTTDVTTASSEADAPTRAVMRTVPVGATATLNRDRANIFDLTSNASDTLILRTKEDATGSDVMREPEQTLLATNKSTLTRTPASASQVTGAPTAAYLLGQSGDNQAIVLWLGRDTLGVTAGGYDAARFHVSYTSPENSRIYTFTSGFIKGTKAVINGDSFDLAPEGDDTDQPHTTHKHVNWLFIHAGRYMLTVQTSTWTPSNTGATNAIAPARMYTIGVAGEASYLAGPGSAPLTNQAQSASIPGMGGITGVPSAPAPTPGAMETIGITDMMIGANPAPFLGARTTSGTTGDECCVATRITHKATEAEATTLASNNASANTAHTTLTVSTGDGASGNTTDGHFNLGPTIENGMLVVRVKDDCTQPAQWVDPSSLTFALGDTTRITAPVNLGFVATPGSSVWLTPSTQIASMPWLGLNSQCEEIITGTTGPVQFTLGAVEDPGRVAVFNVDVLGSDVGEHIFDGPGTGYTLGANMHARQNWVLTAPSIYTLTITTHVTPNSTAPTGSGLGSGGGLTAAGATDPNGRPMASRVVDRIASGKECDPSLATTGAGIIPLTVAPLIWALTGAACVWVDVIERRHDLYEAL